MPAEDTAIPFFNFTEGEEPGLSFLVASPLSRLLCVRVKGLGDGGLRDVLAWAPAEDTQRYFEVLAATVGWLSFRGNFLAAVLLATTNEGGLSMATPDFKTDVGATTADGVETELSGLSSAPAAL